ncbi:MAG: 2-C-methyl-D-erythritol 4-phosphate cytidylyltransferase [Candidatus Omnitrophica bacterium]|nr:2-C-methyl-D-erythritol 4-phosphate cytidylyltransferase [Candidatus Omnitrophota bacterium]
MRVTAIVLAAGKGERFDAAVPKLLVRIGGKPLIAWSLRQLQRHRGVGDIIVVSSPFIAARLERLVRASRFTKVRSIVFGGERRQDSVLQGLGAVGRESGIVLVHDGARPFVSHGMVTSVLSAAAKHGAAVVGVPVKATIKESKGAGPVVKRTLDRSRLWEIQTPQAFRKAVLERAFQRFGKVAVTDDAGLVEKLGVAVRIVPGRYSNIKVTTREDAQFARALVREGAV